MYLLRVGLPCLISSDIISTRFKLFDMYVAGSVYLCLLLSNPIQMERQKCVGETKAKTDAAGRGSVC